MNLRIRHCEPSDLDQLLKLLDDAFVFSRGRSVSMQERYSRVFALDNLHNILLCVQCDQILSSLAMQPFIWTSAGMALHGAMVGMVCTRPAWRTRGCASALLENAEARLRQSGVDFGVLWTNKPAFYEPKGWIAADCGVQGELVIHLAPALFGVDRFACTTPSQGMANIEGIRDCHVRSTVLRQASAYQSLPLPATAVAAVFTGPNHSGAYALIGDDGESRYLYEMVGDPLEFPFLWQQLCGDPRNLVINDSIDSSSYRWLSAQTPVHWAAQAQAMWLPLSKRMAAYSFEKWYVPYFDRI